MDCIRKKIEKISAANITCPNLVTAADGNTSTDPGVDAPDDKKQVSRAFLLGFSGACSMQVCDWQGLGGEIFN